jgi:glycosyltransferase involved in cell wall biosynthesis
MKIVYIANARLPTEKAHGYQIVKTCDAFSKLGAEVTILKPHRHQPDPKLEEQSVFEYYGVEPTFQLRTLYNIDVLRWQTFLPRKAYPTLTVLHDLLWGLYSTYVAKQYAADIYYTRNPEVAYWLANRGLPTVFEAIDIPKRLYRRILLRLSHHSSLKHVVAVTMGLKEKLIEMGFNEKMITVVPDAVDLSTFENTPQKNACRDRLDLPKHSAIVGYIGRFQTKGTEKGVPELLRAMARLQTGREILLLCVGGPMDAVSAYLNQADDLGLSRSAVRFIDRVPNAEVPYWIRACDVVTIPWAWTEFSAHYTSPLKLFEYMAAGVPIVASRLPSLGEILKHGENGWLVEPGDPVELAKGIEDILSNDKRSAGLAKQAGIDVQSYSWSNRAARILKSLSLATGIPLT